jgi:hypothetical protein
MNKGFHEVKVSKVKYSSSHQDDMDAEDTVFELAGFDSSYKL